MSVCVCVCICIGNILLVPSNRNYYINMAMAYLDLILVHSNAQWSRSRSYNFRLRASLKKKNVVLRHILSSIRFVLASINQESDGLTELRLLYKIISSSTKPILIIRQYACSNYISMTHIVVALGLRHKLGNRHTML